MAHVVDARVARFIQRHAVSLRDEVEADVADERDLSPAERWRILESLSRTMEWMKASSPELVASILEWRDPPDPSYPLLIARLRRR